MPNILHNKTFSFVFVCLEVLVGTALAALKVNPSCPDDNPCPNGLAYMGLAKQYKDIFPLCGGDVQDCTAYWTCTGHRGLFRRYSNVVYFHIII